MIASSACCRTRGVTSPVHASGRAPRSSGTSRARLREARARADPGLELYVVELYVRVDEARRACGPGVDVRAVTAQASEQVDIAERQRRMHQARFLEQWQIEGSLHEQAASPGRQVSLVDAEAQVDNRPVLADI